MHKALDMPLLDAGGHAEVHMPMEKENFEEHLSNIPVLPIGPLLPELLATRQVICKQLANLQATAIDHADHTRDLYIDALFDESDFDLPVWNDAGDFADLRLHAAHTIHRCLANLQCPATFFMPEWIAEYMDKT